MIATLVLMLGTLGPAKLFPVVSGQKVVLRKATEGSVASSFSPSGGNLYWIEDRGIPERYKKARAKGNRSIHALDPTPTSMYLNTVREGRAALARQLPAEYAQLVRESWTRQFPRLRSTNRGVLVFDLDRIDRFNDELAWQTTYHLDLNSMERCDKELVSEDGEVVWVIGTAKDDSSSPASWSPPKEICLTFSLREKAKLIAKTSCPSIHRESPTMLAMVNTAECTSSKDGFIVTPSFALHLLPSGKVEAFAKYKSGKDLFPVNAFVDPNDGSVLVSFMAPEFWRVQQDGKVVRGHLDSMFGCSFSMCGKKVMAADSFTMQLLDGDRTLPLKLSIESAIPDAFDPPMSAGSGSHFGQVEYISGCSDPTLFAVVTTHNAYLIRLVHSVNRE